MVSKGTKRPKLVIVNRMDTAKTKIEVFLSELTWLSLKHGIGVNSNGDLFELEQEDTERRYSCDENSKLDFA